MSQLPQKVNPPVGYEYDSFQLNGGLDLISPKITAPKGSLIDCLNREVIDRIGYKRIDGFEPFNGRISPYQPDYYYVESTAYTGTFATDFPFGTALVVEGTTDIFGITIARETETVGMTTTYRLIYARINEDFEPAATEQVATLGNTTDFVVTNAGVQSCIEDIGDTADELIDRFNDYAALIRTNIQEQTGLLMPNQPHGLHWFRDRLYGVCDELYLLFDSGGTTELFANQYLGDGSGFEARVISVQLESGTWGGGDAKGIIQYELLGGLTPANNTNLNTYTDDTFGSTITTNICTVAQASDFTTVPEPLYATLYQALSEVQEQAESGTINNAGWQRIDLGWQADYEDGLSDNELTVVSRGSDNNFTFTSDDEDGFPFNIFNGTNLIGTAFAPNSINPSTAERSDQGYPGWKTNASSTVFADSDALITATDTDDSNYAYATVWYWSAGTAGDNFGFTPGTLTAFDKPIYGPTSSFNGRTAPGGLDSDWFQTQARAPLILNDFGTVAALLPDGALISGVEVIVEYDSIHYAEGQFAADRNGTNGANIAANNILWVNGSLQWGAQFCRSTSTVEATALGTTEYAPIKFQTTAGSYTTNITSSADTDTFDMTATLTTQTTTIGSSTNTFGVSGLSKQDLFDSDLGIALFGQVTSATAYPLSPAMTTVTPSGSENVLGTLRMKVDKITVRFHYTVPSARYYVGDGGGNVCSIDLVYYVNKDGSFSSGTAEGEVQFTNIIEDVAGTKRTVEDGDKLYLTSAAAVAATAGTEVLTFASDADYNGIPALNRILAEGSRYEFITANFFGREDWDGFYGVSGAGRSFSFATYDADGDGDKEQYLVNILTNTEDEEGDTPRHIAYHHNALALGYGSGIVRFSVPGEPENFDGALGAAEIGVGDRVHGLLSMRGTTLGVFCENSIWGIVGTDADNYSTQVLAPYTGALEYTVVDMGIPVYCDSRGVSTLEQSEKYGNFQGLRLSAPVTPWIVPRMLRNVAQFSGNGVICAIPVRNKNQYRVFFKDGQVLVMTINPDQPPSFTFSRYLAEINPANSAYFIAPIAWSSQVDDNGVERIHICHYSPQSLIQSTNYVYELDRGWGFAGISIPAYYTTNWYFRDPFSTTTVKKMRIHGLTQGMSSCKVLTAKDYDLDFGTEEVDISLPRNPLSSFQSLPVPATNIANIAQRGANLTFKVYDEPADEGPLPPDVHQIMLVHFDPGGKPDA